jgi:hypothetical protein
MWSCPVWQNSTNVSKKHIAPSTSEDEGGRLLYNGAFLPNYTAPLPYSSSSSSSSSI